MLTPAKATRYGSAPANYSSLHPNTHSLPGRIIIQYTASSRPQSLIRAWGGPPNRNGRWGADGGGGSRSSSPPPGANNRNPRWRGLTPPPPQGPKEQLKQRDGRKPELRNTARRLYQNERLRALVEQDVEEQHRGRWGTDPNAAVAEEEEAKGPIGGWPYLQQPLQPPSWLDMISGNAEARKVMEWVQEQREARRRQQERQTDDQVFVLAWVYLAVATVVGALGLLAQV